MFWVEESTVVDPETKSALIDVVMARALLVELAPSLIHGAIGDIESVTLPEVEVVDSKTSEQDAMAMIAIAARIAKTAALAVLFMFVFLIPRR
jgi:hypothetical protein